MNYPIFLFLMLLALTANTPAGLSADNPIADITASGYVFLIDTTAYKKSILEEIFDSKNKSTFETVRILKQNVRSLNHEEFYYISLNNPKKKFGAFRWLQKKGDKLYLNNDDLFKRSWIICMGPGNCDPVIFDDTGTYFWSCGEPSCTVGTDTTELKKCKTYKAILSQD